MSAPRAWCTTARSRCRPSPSRTPRSRRSTRATARARLI
ncbi:hypothetical protein GMI68_09890 [Eggerthellaceae bacterium zg-886]|uniref:Uncharacterized protein n=1 Tax=Xiamenia xianingshaonis TaxID=2682776 RepID=A0ABX0IKC3_9ACTN|nr:hypothetical protein [Xiamenia xianingshaonis]